MIDLKELEKALSVMQPRQQLYEIIKREMINRGHWKQLPRGLGGKAFKKVKQNVY